MFAKAAKSPRNNVCCQVFVSDKGYIAVYPMKPQSEFEKEIVVFCKKIAVPNTLVGDLHEAQKSNKNKNFFDQVGTTMKYLERKIQWANRAELYIGILKESVIKDLRISNALMVLWDYAIEP